MEAESNLGNLAQAARGNQLKTARWILIIVGLLTMAVNSFFFLNAKSMIDEELRSMQSQGYEIDQSKVGDAVALQQLITGGTALLGLVFIVLGVMVYQFPVPCTLAGLILYILSVLIFAALNPLSLVQGIIVKIFIVIGLVKSVKSAFAYQTEQAASNSNSGSGFSIN
jgi:hypothetical protein